MPSPALGQRGPRALGVLLSAAVVACGDAPPRPVVPPSAPPREATALTAEVAAVRGLSFRRAVTVEEVRRPRFRSLLRDQLPRDGARLPTLRAFGFVAPKTVASEAAELRLLAEQHDALYVPERRSVVLQSGAAGGDAVLLHELAHALQDDHFPLRLLLRHGTADERMARRAVFEGDAALTVALVLARRRGESEAAALATLEEEATLAEAALRFGGALDADGRRGPALVRAELAFPYGAGVRFATRVYRAGGAALLNRVYKSLPASTEQVLHPEKYAAGELPVEVQPPPAPEGYDALAAGTLGELGASALLAQALPPEEALSASRGWGGDSYRVLRHESSGRLAVAWLSVWDDEPHAARFAEALRAATACGGRGQRPCAGVSVAQRRQGAVVLWSRGLEGDEGALAPLLDATYARAPAKPPLGAVSLEAAASDAASTDAAAADNTAKARPPALDAQRRLAFAAAGVRVRVPKGLAPLPAVRPDEVTLASPDGTATLTLAWVPEGPQRPAIEAVRTAVAATLGASVDAPSRVRAEADRTVESPWGPVQELRWVVLGDRRVTTSYLFVPRCEGAATLLVTRITTTEAAARTLESCIATLEESAAPACPAP